MTVVNGWASHSQGARRSAMTPYESAMALLDRLGHPSIVYPPDPPIRVTRVPSVAKPKLTPKGQLAKSEVVKSARKQRVKPPKSKRVKRRTASAVLPPRRPGRRVRHVS